MGSDLYRAINEEWMAAAYILIQAYAQPLFDYDYILTAPKLVLGFVSCNQ